MAGATDPGLGEVRRDSRVGAVLADRYRIDALVDRGSMGRVYLGEHVLMKKRVAIKVLHRELSTVPEFVARFEREAMAAANIDNEHVVAATDFGKLPDGSVFLVLEFVEGKNLRDEMAQGPMPLVRSLHIARQIAYALRSAHALSIVHRDLKPENVMLVEKAGDPDFVKVLDFGIAKVPMGDPEEHTPTYRPITKTGMVFGTPEYMPPEQALGQNVDHRADLYSLGVILYELLAGVRPFFASSQVGILGQQVSQSAPPVSKRAPGVTIPPLVEQFIGRLLQREAARRFQSAQAVLDAIDRFLGYSSGRQRIPTLRDGTSAPAADTDPAPESRPEKDRSGADDLSAELRLALGGPTILDRLGGWVDARRSVLPTPLRRVPGAVLFSVPLAVVGVALGFVLVSVLSTDGKKAPPDAAAAVPAPSVAPSAGATVRASADELRTAADEGPTALVSLAETYPKDARIHLALGAALLQQKELEGAVRAIAAALALDPSLKNDEQIASALWVTAQNKRSSAATLDVLKGPMQERGRAILKDLATTPAVKAAVREDARRALTETENAKPY